MKVKVKLGVHSGYVGSGREEVKEIELDDDASAREIEEEAQALFEQWLANNGYAWYEVVRE